MVYFNPTTYSWKEILGPVLGKTRSWGWGKASVWSSPLLLEEGLINMLEGWIEGETQTDSTDRWRKRPRIEGENPNQRHSQRLSGDRSLRRRWVSPPQKFFKNAYLKPCILVYSWSEIYIFSIGSRNFPKKGWNQISIFYFNFSNNKVWQEPRKFNRMRLRIHRLEIENRKCL